MKTKKKFIYLILLCVVLLILLILGDKTTKTSVITNNIEDKNVKEKLINKIKIMSADDLLGDLYSKDFNINTMDHKLALTGILLSLEEDGTLSVEESDELYNSIDICTNTDYINLNSIETIKKEIYGSITIDYNKSLKDSNFYYDVANDRIYSLCTSDINKNNFIESYVYDFKIKDDRAYVYVSIAFGKERYSDDLEKIEIYKDYKYEDLYKSYKEGEYFTIDETNYEYFSLYKYTFKKINNDYYFYGLERIKK